MGFSQLTQTVSGIYRSWFQNSFSTHFSLEFPLVSLETFSFKVLSTPVTDLGFFFLVGKVQGRISLDAVPRFCSLEKKITVLSIH